MQSSIASWRGLKCVCGLKTARYITNITKRSGVINSVLALPFWFPDFPHWAHLTCEK